MNTSKTYDLSGGDRHMRNVAEETGIDWQETHSCIKRFRVKGRVVLTWYNEGASSPLSAWCAFLAGGGTFHGASLEEAKENVARYIGRLAHG